MWVMTQKPQSGAQPETPSRYSRSYERQRPRRLGVASLLWCPRRDLNGSTGRDHSSHRSQPA
jgi:hypothetical protein